ncbi:hypothetical protein OAO55_01845 [Bacteroidales bacterium]|nr:hypothetical protein [Bacteroidales bacterium]
MNENFSKEYLFELSKVKNHAIGITFKRNSSAYNRYGSDIVVDLEFEDDEFESLTRNYTSAPPVNTHGKMKAKALVTKNLTEGQIESLKDEGFDTSDISAVRHV